MLVIDCTSSGLLLALRPRLVAVVAIDSVSKLLLALFASDVSSVVSLADDRCCLLEPIDEADANARALLKY